MDIQTSFLDRLFESGLLIDTGIDGLYGRSGQFEDVISAFERLIYGFGGADGAEAIRFPPGMNRALFEASGYMKSFPQLAGTVHSFCGSEFDHTSLLKCMEVGEDWTKDQEATDIVLTPAACYPLYPTVAKRGPLPESGALFDLQSYCFRHEPSKDPARQQLFRMREYVCMGTKGHVTDFRQSWMDRGLEMMKAVGLDVVIDVANDPFFGRAGKMLANNQRDQNLKFELLIPITSSANPTACMSFNYHQDAFGAKWGLNFADGSVAHTACVAFGLERIALALFHHHGLNTAEWPQSVRKALWG
ncbi:amino acid--[acyl-carrier-protein] ligase [Rhizobium sp. SEMIA 4085]|uniref:Aminoacyl-tRNA synthetase-like domain-containing protein n=1 Tax=Rhizobium gallicum bv. gallicum R602sp TaxID=1041138 RepID=A0A0B4X702_9HYPH|nr:MULTISPECIES: amino acid--[acyl-carrier-protein] ligase [Rhizobium]AJD43829.1 aminoacyl-tRNA synthetase-like domain-containing protein [Rhizobium gallicum bv. gallicum R602sp]NNH33168.1 amino acid--[acyl-carrier-protein] ligase [Rhizobium sp. SEMIA 4085]TDW34308.1 seryl-tRNA synthetase [Rhizobium azibense]